MSIETYQNHKGLTLTLSVFLAVLMLVSCFSICMVDVDAAALEIGISLIALILSGFGIVASTTGAVDGMNQGLESLMGEYSESQGHESGWFRGLFNTDNITSKGYNRLGIGGVLVAGIKLFTEWLREDKGLTSDEPLVMGDRYLTASINGVIVPLAIGTLQSDNTYYNLYPENELPTIAKGQTINFTINGVQFGIRADGVQLPGGNRVSDYNNSDSITYGFFFNSDHTRLYFGARGTRLFNIAGYNSIQSFDTSYVTVGNYTIGTPLDNWQVDDNNLDTSYLDNEDGSTKDVIFMPVYPVDMPLDDIDLGTISGIEDAAERMYDYTQTETGTAVGEGEIATESNLQPGDNSVPDITIPSGGFFGSIWHYVIKAMQDAAEGIAFLINLVNTVVPPAILNLAWASVVLVIVFGILNKFLE